MPSPELYGVWGEKKMYGKTYMGVARATFVIDPEGRVANVFPKVSPKTHDEVVLEALGELASRMNASAPFTNDRYDEEAYAEAEGIELSRVHISRTFTGDLEGGEHGRADDRQVRGRRRLRRP